MGALPKEPRQKMINIMYLVLTALLALNVSSEILSSFRVINNSLLNSNIAIENKNQTLFRSFQEKLTKNETKEKAARWWAVAEKVKLLSESAYDYIENLKLELKKEAGYNPPKEINFKEDDLDAATRLFLEGKHSKGSVFLEKLIQYKEQVLSSDPDIKKQFTDVLPLDLSVPNKEAGPGARKISGESLSKVWAYSYFHMTPTIAAITILTKFQNDIKNSESQVVEYCHKQIGAVDVIFDSYTVFSGINSQYFMPGQELVITAGVGAFSKSAQPTVFVDGISVPVNPVSGAAEYKSVTGSPGSYVKKIKVDFFNQATGKFDSKQLDVKYTVGSPTGVTVSADAVKVLYIGVENPISIAGGSKGAEDINASIDNGTIINNGNGLFVAKVVTPGTATITVSVGGTKAPYKFKVKRIPPPVPMVGNSMGGKVPINVFKSNVGVRADMKDFVFENVKYNIKSYTIACSGKGFEASGGLKVAQVEGPYFNAEAKQFIEMCKVGSSVTIFDIVVEGPDGVKKLDGNVTYLLVN